ncbi:hypothetical protein HDK90DRAFT_558158 [Phyllosticta capitalensis]|uniref:Uncharacterized protein n=1 Tax=Phyllosticta capitalensis TaxID=121624 RepID=A0ABR1YH97_9PEZI
MFYITYDMSGSEKSELEALAKRIYQKILAPDMAPKPPRFDIHFLGAQATTEHCIENYRQARIVPSYECGDFCGYHSYLFKIPDPEWERGKVGMIRVAFDPAESDRFAMNRPVMEHQRAWANSKAASVAHQDLPEPANVLRPRSSSVSHYTPIFCTSGPSKIMSTNTGVKARRRKAPCRVFYYYRHFRDHDGRPAVSTWCGRCSLPPLFSFQLYVTYDVSEAETSDLETLAKELHSTLLDCNVNPIRFDLHFLRPDASTEDCVAHYNYVKQSPPEDPSMRVVPSYVAADYSRHHAFFIKVSSPDWQRDATGLSRVFFEPAGSCGIHDDPPIREAPLSIEQAKEASLYLYDFVDVKEDCEVVYELAQAAGLAEW